MAIPVPRTGPIPKTNLLRDWHVLESIYQAGGMTRYQLGASTGLNRTTVARIVSDLLERNLLVVEETRNGRQKRGRPSEVLRINPAAGHSVGIEFGRRHLVTVVTDAIGTVCLSKQLERTPEFVASDSTMDDLATAIEAVVKDAGIAWETVQSVGLALHDVVNANGEWHTHEQLSEPPYAAKQYMETRLGRLVVAEDVSRSFAASEHSYGAGRNASDMVYAFLGSHGVGGGIFVNNQLLKSSSGVCGEIGHIVVDQEGRLCRCGNRGCFETFASHAAILTEFDDLVKQGVMTSLNDNDQPPTFADLCCAAGAGDKGAYLVLHRLAHFMGKALATVVNICGAPLIVIGGQLKLAGDDFLADVGASVRQHAIASLARDVSVKYAQAPDHAGAWGVAVQALEVAWAEGVFLKE